MYTNGLIPPNFAELAEAVPIDLYPLKIYNAQPNAYCIIYMELSIRVRRVKCSIENSLDTLSKYIEDLT